MNLQEIIQRIQATRSLPSDEDLRRLPYLKAFVYGRVSSQAQVRESRESIRDIAKLVMTAKKDGYKSSLNPDDVEKWLASIQSGADVNRVIEDGDIIIDCSDLGLSGSLGEDKRPGLAHLERRVESGEVGAVYLTEGMSRLSRDRDRVLGYRLLKLLKQHTCRIRTVEGVYNPAIPRDWHHLAEDVDNSAEEMKTSGIRMGARRWDKAAEGKHVGSPVCPGYIVPIEDQRRDGSYVFGKWQLYQPHQQVVIEALQEVVKQRSLYRAVQALQARMVVFPFFPKDLKHMETRSALRFYGKDSTGYIITYNALKGLATNLRLVGIWQWRDILIVNNHDPAVTVDLFEQAYEIAASTKPKGRAAYAEPMEWAGLLYCYDHDEPRRVSTLNREHRWACRSTTPPSSEAPCLQIADHFLTPPLTRAFLDCLDLTPHAEAVLEKLKSEVSQNSLEESQQRRRETELKTHIVNLERYLGCGDPEREETYWRLIREERAKLDLLRQRPAAPKATPLDLDRVAQFLENLDSEWERYPSRLRNRLIKLLIDRIELRHDVSHIEAVICWKIGLKQAVNIRRPATNFAKEKVWRVEEENLLRMLWPSSSREAIMAAFPNRTWEAIGQRAGRLKISRQWVRVTTQKSRRWTNEEKEKLRELYSSKASVDDIARELGRSRGTVISMAHVMGLSRPKELRYRRREPAWEPITIKLFQESSSLS
jgi:DNA invertase Pin-like site-specific DNA recombinase